MALGLSAWLVGCTGISIAPSCPNELEVSEFGVVAGNVIDPGAAPEYLWEAIPSDAGTFDDAGQPITRFTAAKAGDVTIRLTASDGLYQVISQCHILVGGGEPPDDAAGVAVSLSFDPAQPTVGLTASVTCRSTGTMPATTFDVTQTDGATVSFSVSVGGSRVFTPTEPGDLTFECVGTADDGSESNPAQITLTVVEAGDGGRPDR